MILLIASITVWTNDTLGGAVAFASLPMAKSAMVVAETWGAIATISRVSMVASNAVLTVRSFGAVLTGLKALRWSIASAMSIALAFGAVGEVPIWSRAEAAIESVHRTHRGQWSRSWAFQALALACIAAIITPATSLMLLTGTTCLEVLTWQGWALGGSPLSALGQGKGGSISIGFKTSLLADAPHTTAWQAGLACRSWTARVITLDSIVVRQYCLFCLVTRVTNKCVATMIILPATVKFCVASMAVMKLVAIAAFRLLALFDISLVLSCISQALRSFRTALVSTYSATPHATIVILQTAWTWSLLFT